MKKALAVLTAISLFGSLAADDLSPWFGNYLEFEPSLQYIHQKSNAVDVAGATKDLDLKEDLVNASIACLVDPSWDVKIDLLAGRDRFAHKGSGTHFRRGKFLMRHFFTQDLSRGTVSCSGGFSLALSDRSQLKSLQQMQKSWFEAACHGAIGKEFILASKRYLHIWAAALIGVGAEASAWLEGEAHADLIFDDAQRDSHRFGIFLKSTRGFGTQHTLDIHSHQPYRRLQFHTVDAGAGYYFLYYSLGSCAIELTKRLAARNCPKNQFGVTLTVTLPFSL